MFRTRTPCVSPDSGTAPPARDAARLGRTLPKIGLAFLALSVALVGTEVAVRVLAPVSNTPLCAPDRLYGWRLRPNQVFCYFKPGDTPHPISGRINGQGWRDNETSLAKPKGVYRVAILGDSYVEAVQVETERRFDALAEAALNGSLPMRVEMLTFGVSGWGQAQEYLALTHDVERYSPDMVILFFNPANDISDEAPETNGNALSPYPRVNGKGDLYIDASFNSTGRFKLKCWIHAVRRRSALFTLVFDRVKGLIDQRASPRQKKGQTLDGYLTLCTSHPDPQHAGNYELSKLVIRQMAAYCKSRDIPFMLVCLDTIYQPEMVDEYRALDGSFDADFFSRDMEAFSGRLGIAHLDLQQPFREFYRKNGASLHWGHWNYLGHQVVADALARRLAELLKPPAVDR